MAGGGEPGPSPSVTAPSGALSLAYLSLGANIGERERTLGRALALVAATPGVRLMRVSSLYATDPVGYLDQPEFLNCAAVVESALDGEELLGRLRAIELELGRMARGRWREREIDIDIIFFGDQVIGSDRLTVPHPEMERRAFVLMPLAEIAPEVLHPVLGATVRSLLERCGDRGGIRRVASDTWPQSIGV